MIYYPAPLHVQPAYAAYGFKPGDYPISEQCSDEVLSLPMHTELDHAQVTYIVEQFLACYHQS